VTTADLWRLKEGVTISDIRASDEIQQVVIKHDLLFCYEPPDNELQKHSMQKLINSFDETQIKRMDKLATARGLHSFHFYAEYLSRYYPCFFVIISLDRLQATLLRSIEFFSKRVFFWNGKTKTISRR
jgi:hypothetical protein